MRTKLALAASLASLFVATPAAAATVPFTYGPAAHEDGAVFPAASPGSVVAVNVHGGWWHSQTHAIEDEAQMAQLQKAGVTVFDVNYPLDGPGVPAFPMEVEAVERATRWAMAEAAAYSGDPANVVLLGGSAGGNLSALAAQRLDAQAPGTIRASVELSGPQNLVELAAYEKQLKAEGKAAPGYQPLATALGCGSLALCTEAHEREWSPMTHVDPVSCPPSLLASSEADIIPLAGQREMLAQLQAAGCEAKLLVVPKGHSYSYWGAVVNGTTATVANEVLAFMRSH